MGSFCKNTLFDSRPLRPPRSRAAERPRRSASACSRSDRQMAWNIGRPSFASCRGISLRTSMLGHTVQSVPPARVWVLLGHISLSIDRQFSGQVPRSGAPAGAGQDFRAHGGLSHDNCQRICNRTQTSARPRPVQPHRRHPDLRSGIGAPRGRAAQIPGRGCGAFPPSRSSQKSANTCRIFNQHSRSADHLFPKTIWATRPRRCCRSGLACDSSRVGVSCFSPA